MARQSANHDRLRQALAREAARLMIEHGHADFGVAKRKAALRLGVSNHAVLPRNSEIEAALAEHQRLFAADSHATELEHMRHSALRAMRLLQGFDPRLVGPVLAGTASAHNDITLHVFADTAEAVVICLLEAGVRHQAGERKVKLQRDVATALPAIRFALDDCELEVVVFGPDGIRQAPFSPVDGKPMKRASREELSALLTAGLPAAVTPLF